jgi:hypothetical protein
MIKIHTILRDIITEEVEAYIALTNGYMNMSSYAAKILPLVEERTKKQLTINSLVVALSRLKKEFKNEKPLIPEVQISNITSKLPLSEVIYEKTVASVAKLELLHRKMSIAPGDFFTSTVSTTEINVVCSSGMIKKVTEHFNIKPKLIVNNLAAVGISFDKKYFKIPNTLFALISIIARARINISEIVSTYTELIFVVEEKDFAKVVSLFSR